MIGKLKTNLKREKEIIKELVLLTEQSEKSQLNQKEISIAESTSKSLLNQLNILNNTIPEILKKITLIKKLKEKPEKEGISDVKEVHPSMIKHEEKTVTIKEEDKKRYLKEISNTRDLIRKLKEKSVKKKKEKKLRASKIVKIANKLFLKRSLEFVDRFYGLKKDLQKANFQIMLSSYVSLMFLFTFLSVFVGIIVFSLLMIMIDGGVLTKLAQFVWIIPGVPILTFFSFYFYPKTEASSIQKRIEQELPFVTINMSAIAGSKVEPTNIFKIIVEGQDYPYTKKEFKKLLNQVNLYGYDLVNALKNIAKNTSSQKLTELFNGLATTISSGGDLNEFLNKRAETLLLDYRLEREKYIKSAETMMNVYISIVIAAPMILMLMLIMISIAGLSFGIGIGMLTFIILAVVALINIIFLVFLHLKNVGF